MSAPVLPPPPAGPAAGPVDRLLALADQCVLCGACLPHCPTYALDRQEAESPRGRVMLMKARAEGKVGLDATGAAHLDHCLACRHCERVCPAQVRYGELLELGRKAQRAVVAPPLRQRLIEWLLPRRRLLALAARTGAWLRLLLPGPWRRLPAAPPRRAVGAFHAAAGPARGRVALFIGCLGELHERAAVQGAIVLLTRLGWDVVVPTAQTCCGAVHRHAGASNARLAARNRTAFGPEPVAVLTLASGCHETIEQQLAGTLPVRDALDFVSADERLSALSFRPARERVALHLPCTQRNLLRNGARMEALLRRVPGATLALLPEAGCCGAAGSHLFTAPTRADALRAPLLDALQAVGATTLCSANVGCRMHLAAGLETRGAPLRVMHPLQWLAEHLE